MLEMNNVSKVYKGGKKAVSDLNISIKQGEFIAFIGTSGSGKTTAMRMINRMIEPTSGTITLDGKNIKELNPVQLRRKIGYVIQQIGLLPHMTIRDNITLVPKLLKWSEVDKNKKAEELIQLVDLPLSYLDLYPSQLSGGQQQRIGVVRALAADQDIILMDEPFGALDPLTRDTLQDLVKELQVKFNKTFIMVTHDMDEAIKLADRIVIMSNGEVVQLDTPNNILRRPANDFVRDFIGENRLIQTTPNVKTVDEAMVKPISVTAEKSIGEAIQIMRERRVDTLLITDNDNVLVGYVDIEDLSEAAKKSLSLSRIMNHNVYFVRSGVYLQDTVRTILKRNIRLIPVLDKHDRLLGVITRANLVDIVYDTIWGEELEEV
ncbi:MULTISPECIES: betaine/proline/choline family ABC transporter ATP-binding protein [Macrococcus]|uniref:Quaternary amine transport ATP-binding protein n=1 Tax=Macrococcus psychrotolerans TaxID=3039389 RepID=A0AAU6RIW6_9STAP|nr:MULTISPECIES: betaine/proline/choline family ABC transporter ATP-binding protein [Macrococcus]MDJ1112408.1 betaine/proline/choline family ABC transporter ATP-binding protein [Macrococcus sp. S115]QYA32350.1 betaine/proline/choline family ABC transporter ATP-binding protein [Macrococcus sp. 19Msa1099]QYA37157.1 betaine/proline/choline family ABC transporter ATP-binding protein [Macrococcus caseolyticus]QYA75865.1 betaine/proline/choline family ABC transporter ATP-binding protein [Macrococcus 